MKEENQTEKAETTNNTQHQPIELLSPKASVLIQPRPRARCHEITSI
jgi:hypothetical protein